MLDAPRGLANALRLGACAWVLSFSSAQAVPEPQFPRDRNCVSYTTRERVFMVKVREVVGLNCAVQSAFAEPAPNLLRFDLTIPIRGFRSGSELRDSKVRDILNETLAPNALLTTELRTPEEWRRILAQKSFSHNGFLALGGTAIALPSFRVDYAEGGDRFVRGHAALKFSDVKLEPPEVLGGFAIKVFDELRFDFQIRHDLTAGIERIQPLAFNR